MNDVVSFVKEVVKQVSPADIAILAGLLTAGVHGLLKRYKELGKVANVVTSFVLPVVGAILTAVLADKSALLAYPQVYAAAQTAYYIFNAVKTGATWLQLGKTVSQFEKPPLVQPDQNF